MPRQLMLKDLKFKVQYDRRGKISAGRLSEDGAMEKLDFFDVSDFPEIVEMYGQAPKALTIFLPTNNPLDFMGYRWERWASKAGKGVMVRFCDGETCVHRIQEIVKERTYVAGEETACICEDLNEEVKEEKDRMCKRHFWLKAYVVHPETYKHRGSLACWFDCHSKNSAENVLSEIYLTLKRNFGILQNVPFEISVAMVQDALEAKKNFPVWNIRALGSMEALQQETRQMLKEAAVEQGPFAGSLLQLGPGTPEAPRQAESETEKPQAAQGNLGLYEIFVKTVKTSTDEEELAIVQKNIAGVKSAFTVDQRAQLSELIESRKADLQFEKEQSQ